MISSIYDKLRGCTMFFKMEKVCKEGIVFKFSRAKYRNMKISRELSKMKEY